MDSAERRFRAARDRSNELGAGRTDRPDLHRRKRYRQVQADRSDWADLVRGLV